MTGACGSRKGIGLYRIRAAGAQSVVCHPHGNDVRKRFAGVAN